MIERSRINIGVVLRSYGIMIGLILIIIAASILEPAFFSGSNMLNILRQISVIGVCALGMTYVMIAGGMDLSIGSTVSLCAVVAIMIMNGLGVNGNADTAALLAIAASVAAGLLVGIGNGAVIALIKGRMGESFIITYSMQIVVAALALLVSGGQFMAGKFPEGLYSSLGTGLWPIVIFAALAVIMQFVLARTKFGRTIFFIGANMDAAFMSGLKVRKLRIINHAICGGCAGLAAIIVSSRVNSASPLQGVGYELDAIAAVVVGGTSLTGGFGSVAKTVIGVLVIGVLANALNVIGVNANAQYIVRGAIIIIAVGLDVWNRSHKAKELAK
jgi:ribose/xylose/arabinose/galactoside ABC-type transport system permease subunit